MTIEPMAVAALAAVAAAVGWWCVHYLTGKRDVSNDQRKQRVEHLIETFQDLVRLRTYQSDPTLDYIPIVLRITNNIQLFGTIKQIDLFSEFVSGIQSGKVQNVHTLIDLVRDDIREMIKMVPLSSTVAELRVRHVQRAPEVAKQSEAYPSFNPPFERTHRHDCE